MSDYPSSQFLNSLGGMNSWPHFYDSFASLIHNNDSLTDVQRFHYLVAALKGEAAQVVASLEITAANYKIAWDLLRARFENKKIIIRTHVKNLFDLPSVTRDARGSLRHFLDSFLQNFRALKNLQEDVDHWDTILLYLLTSKLDPVSKREWEVQTHKQISPSIDEFIIFLSNRCQLLEALELKNTPGPGHVGPRGAHGTRSAHIAVTSKPHPRVKSTLKCVCCGLVGHQLFRCEEFIKLAIPARIKQVKKAKACANCLKRGHEPADCYYGPCRTCGKKHNTLLHLGRSREGAKATPASVSAEPEGRALQGQSSSQPDSSPPEQANGAITTHSTDSSFVLLSTARVSVFDHQNKAVGCRALLDNGSQSCFMTSEVCQRLRLNIIKERLPVTGISGVTTNILGRVRARIGSVSGEYTWDLEFLILDKITDNIPQIKCEVEAFCLPCDMRLADPAFDSPGTVELLLGASVFYDLLLAGQMRVSRLGPILQNSKLGWIVSGPLGLPNVTARACHVTQITIANQLEKFWTVEDAEGKAVKWSKEEAEVEEHFCESHTRDSTGRFIVRLPVRPNLCELGNNLTTATNRFHSLERKFQRDSSLYEKYAAFMNEYAALGHMSPVTALCEPRKTKCYYLPHHAVVKGTSLTTKQRTVFDASCKSESGLSLNDVLKTGPCIQDDIFVALLRFRMHNVAFTSDVAKMYRQFLVHEEDRDLQRILWRSDPLGPLVHYRLNTVTYGTSPASFLATRCLKQLAIENKARFPKASRAIEREFYMDDWIGGARDSEAAIKLIEEVTDIFKTAGLVLRQWVSNDCSVMQKVASSPSELEYNIKSDQESNKILGVLWDATRDKMRFNVTPKIGGEITKRAILSAIAQLFDPLGLIGPVILTAKIIMQELWRDATGWDDPVSPSILTKWSTFFDNLTKLRDIALPRQVIFRGSSQFKFHVFCDASQAAYGACVYIRTIAPDTGQILVRLVCSKSRVAPIKLLTLPRLELCGAVLAVQLLQRVAEALDAAASEALFWCDSTIVLAWIASEPHQFKTFVANRIATIQRFTSANQWRYVPGRLNSADYISRGLYPHEIRCLSEWWRGPEFLATDESDWPVHPLVQNDALPETKQSSLVSIQTSEKFDLIERYSSLSRLTRVCAYVLRFIYNCKVKAAARRKGALSSEEIQKSTSVLVRIVQHQAYSDEIRALKNFRAVARTSKLSNLNPFLDEAFVVRVGGRLHKSQLNFARKHPMILPAKHHFTTLVVREAHLTNLHAGVQTVLSVIRERFWPLNGRQTVRSVLRKCLICFRVKPRHLSPQMGQLPAARVSPSRPFTNCGIDYAGPYWLKERKLRNKKLVKAYLCVFVCFATKAVHIEPVGDLTTEGFLNALKRFVARRGACKCIYSDNATNFVGAQRQLGQFLELAQEPGVVSYLSNRQMEWKFIPPRSPHFGGLWESAVRSIKYHLKRIIFNVPLTFEEFYTYLAQIEGILNSRPLCALSEDPDDLEVLTPGHFLIGAALNSLPELPVEDSQITRVNRYKHLQLLVQHFWSRWSKVYLHSLQQLSKWRVSNVPERLIGSLVLLHEDNVPPMSWRLGRIVETHPGRDGAVRVVTIKTRDGMFKRAVARISLLPVEY